MRIEPLYLKHYSALGILFYINSKDVMCTSLMSRSSGCTPLFAVDGTFTTSGIIKHTVETQVYLYTTFLIIVQTYDGMIKDRMINLRVEFKNTK